MQAHCVVVMVKTIQDGFEAMVREQTQIRVRIAAFVTPYCIKPA